MENHFQIESVRSAVSARDKLLCRFSDVQCFLSMRSAHFSSRVANALDVGSSICKNPSVGALKTKKRCIASGSNGAKKPVDIVFRIMFFCTITVQYYAFLSDWSLL